MSAVAQPGGELIWEELLTPPEIRAWVMECARPERLKRELSSPGVYRFIFPEFKDENGRHTPFYVGEAGNLGSRLASHFAQGSDAVRRDKNGLIHFRAGRRLRGAIQGSLGEFSLEVLRVEGSIDFSGVKINQDIFKNTFGRRLLENWALLQSIQAEHPRHLNAGLKQQGNGLRDLRKRVIEKSRKRLSLAG